MLSEEARMYRSLNEAAEFSRKRIFGELPTEKLKSVLRTHKFLSDLATDEIKAYIKYKYLADATSNPITKELMNHISNEEYHHYNELIDAIRRLPDTFK